MVVATVGVVAIVATGGVAAIPVLAASAAPGASIGVVTTVAGTAAATGTAVAGTAAAGGVVGVIGGSIAGAATTGAVSGAVTGALAGAGSAAAVTSASAGAAGIASSAATTVAALSGPIGWLALGTEEARTHTTYTFDCWKAVLHDESADPSQGKLLKDVVADSRIKQITLTSTDDSTYPQIILENIWDEQYRIDYVRLPGDQLAAHAVQF